ncbi:MAG: hypothetical protein SFH39_07190 [Candidatus Magnetobacterium sp. LHC-1]|uniref:hypothetical protein n=1 Tax=Candidatus Magnetobacterium casense TaxID=1455061 RepID=UPI0021002DA3|nr:hypothetical protein [Candidatus Magnetobacterium casensis]
MLRKRPYLTVEMCREVIANPVRREEQSDGRIRLWGKVGDKYLRVVTLEDGVTIHNAFIDGRFKE